MGSFDYTGDAPKVQPVVDTTEDSAELDGLDDDITEDTVDDTEESVESDDSDSIPMNVSARPAKAEPKTVKPAVQPGAPAPAQGDMSPEQQKAIQESVLRMVGADAVLKVKGVERKLSELSPAEITMHLQKAMRADQLMQETASERKKIAEERELVERGARAVQAILDQQQNTRVPTGQGMDASIPDYLRPHPDDSDEVKFYKEQQIGLMNRVNTMESAFANTQRQAQQEQFVGEIKNLHKEYPMASLDEVVAIKSVRPDINTEDLIRKSHEYYSSEKFIENAFNANPTAKREFEERVIKDYLARRGAAKKIGGAPTAASGSKSVTERPKARVTDFNSADVFAKRHVANAQRESED